MVKSTESLIPKHSPLPRRGPVQLVQPMASHEAAPAAPTRASLWLRPGHRAAARGLPSPYARRRTRSCPFASRRGPKAKERTATHARNERKAFCVRAIVVFYRFNSWFGCLPFWFVPFVGCVVAVVSFLFVIFLLCLFMLLICWFCCLLLCCRCFLLMCVGSFGCQRS